MGLEIYRKERRKEVDVDSATQNISYGGIKAKPSTHSVRLGIGANHIAQTNAGFSRKLDGTFYSL